MYRWSASKIFRLEMILVASSGTYCILVRFLALEKAYLKVTYEILERHECLKYPFFCASYVSIFIYLIRVTV